MKKYIGVVCLFFSITVCSQPLRDINYAYLYNPNESFSFNLKPVGTQDAFRVLYSLQVKDTTGFRNEFAIEWEGRNVLADKEGVPVALGGNVISFNRTGLSGELTIPSANAPKYLVAKVIRTSLKRAWIFYTPLELNFPVNNYFTRNEAVVMEPYVHTNEALTLSGDSLEWIVSYYDDDFPAAAPAFSEAQARVSRGMVVDSVYRVKGGAAVTFPMKGLYLLQKDTTSLQAFSFRAEDDYPQYSRLINLPGPLVYITTRQEYERLASSLGNKKAFDRVILNITADTERARILMRSYFKRVELANRYFTSYKEGWKTDRGMIYIIFGMPEEVLKFSDREVWNYRNEQFNIRFTFSKSSSLFDPDNFVLIREKKHENTWYEVIDLWRNARFY